MIEKSVRTKLSDAGGQGLAALAEVFEDAGNQYLDIADEIRAAILKAKGKTGVRKASKSRSAK